MNYFNFQYLFLSIASINQAIASLKELNLLLTKADIQPPYILVGNSFGSYNVRLYAKLFAPPGGWF